MKFVGATDWFIRWPFIIEGAIIGFAGAAFASLVLFYTYNLILVKLSEIMLSLKILEPCYVLGTMLWQFILAGIVIGGISSSWSLYEFLKV
jgi:cell division transport system permease protein